MLFDLSSLVQRHEGLTHLEVDFSVEEINYVVRQLPNFKSSGPHGFNNEFMKNVGSPLDLTFTTYVGVSKDPMSVCKVSTTPSSL
jgi:hypothetical protein